MNCRDVFERLSAAIDGELSAEESVSLRRHLEHCATCTRSMQVLETARDAYRSIASAPDTAPVARASRAQARQVGHPGWWVAAAATVVGLAALWYLRPPTGTVDSPPPTLHPVPGVDRAGGQEEALSDAAIDCGRPHASICILDVPCSNGECVPPAPGSSGT